MAEPKDILDFWTEAGPKKWWKKDDAFDASIRARFGQVFEEAAAGKLDNWVSEPNTLLALIIVLDQFSRNLFRNDPRAFAQDSKALDLAKLAISTGFDHKMPKDVGTFCYLPLMHSEDLADQKDCLAEFERLQLELHVKSAKEHLEIIERFGRFPHRNKVLGRQSSAEEIAFLEGGGFKG